MNRVKPQDFYSWTGPRPVAEVAGHRVRGPAYYHRADAFEALHLASYEAVRAALPTEDLFPVRWFDGRAVVQVMALRYHEVSGTDVTDGEPGWTRMLSPYGEVAVSALVTRRPRPRGVPLFRPTVTGVGGFVLHLPVTTREARDLGLAIFGLPKFVADMDFTESPTARTVTVSEAGAEVLTLTVRPGGPVAAALDPLSLYSVLEGRLLETSARALGHRQVRVGHAGGELTLGSHPVGQSLRALEFSSAPLMVFSYLDQRLVLPWGAPVGIARDYMGHVGEDRERGRFTVAYPGTGPLDQYEITVGPVPRQPGVTQPV
jgi:hypothetical protein